MFTSSELMNRFHACGYLMLQSVKVPSERSEREISHMGKLNGKTAVIMAATSGMALATAKRFVEEGAYVFITGRNRERLDRAVKEIGRNVTGVQADSSKLADLDKLYATVKKEKGKVDILFASAGEGKLRIGGGSDRSTFRLDLQYQCARHAVYCAEGAAAVQQ